jgi:lysophospholipase L1-like esterase
MKKRIVFFGDSLVYGLRDSSNGERFPLNQRPHSYLQELLGEDYEVIDEGLRSRTINVDDPSLPDKNGFDYFRPCIESIEPEMVIIWLGTNNTKHHLQQTPDMMIEQFHRITTWAQEKYKDMGIVVVPPPQINSLHLNEKMMNLFGMHAEGLIIQYHSLLKEYCIEHNLLYVSDIENIQAASVDGIHLSQESNRKVAEYIYNLISKEHRI